MSVMLSAIARVIVDAVELIENGRSEQACELLKSVIEAIGRPDR